MIDRTSSNLSDGYLLMRRMLQNGHSENEIQLATMQAARTRKERLETINEIRQKLKALMSRGKVLQSSSIHRMSASPMALNQLPPSPIVPRKSPARATHLDGENFAHLRLPTDPGSMLSPRGLSRRKRPAPLDLGGDLFQEDALTPHIYNNTPKRLRSPCNDNYAKSVLSPYRENLCTSMRYPARVKSPMVDSRPLLQPRRLASPPPSMLYHRSTPPRAT